MTDELRQWLESLKVGDEVCVESRHGYSIEKVTKVPKTQIVTQHGRFRKDTGYAVGGASIWSLSSIKPVTDEIRNNARKEKIVLRLSNQTNFKFRGLSLDQLERINSIIDEGKKWLK